MSNLTLKCHSNQVYPWKEAIYETNICKQQFLNHPMGISNIILLSEGGLRVVFDFLRPSDRDDWVGLKLPTSLT